MTANVIQFATRHPQGATRQANRDKEELRKKARVEKIRQSLKSRLSQKEACQLREKLGQLIEKDGLRARLTDIIRAAGIEGSSATKNRTRYIQFADDKTVPPPAKDGTVFLKLAEAVGILRGGELDASKDQAISELVRDIPRFEDVASGAVVRDASEANRRLIELLELGVARIARRHDLAGYFDALEQNGLDVRDDGSIASRTNEEGFYPSEIYDASTPSEWTQRLPRFLPRIRIASLWHLHAAYEIEVPGAAESLSETDRADPDRLYDAGLAKLNLARPQAHSGGIFPKAPEDFSKYSRPAWTRIWAYRVVDIWLAIAPLGYSGAIRPVLLIVEGVSQDQSRDVWATEFPPGIALGGFYTLSEPTWWNDPQCNWPQPSSDDLVEWQRQMHEKDVFASARLDENGSVWLRAEVPADDRRPFGDPLRDVTTIRFPQEVRDDLFARCWLFTDAEEIDTVPDASPSARNDRPRLIRHFVDPDAWSPGPMRSLGGALLRNLVHVPMENSVLNALEESAARLRQALDDFDQAGHDDFSRTFAARARDPLGEAGE